MGIAAVGGMAATCARERAHAVTPSSPIRAVLFDAAHTLLHVVPSVGAVYSRTAQRHGVAIEAERLEAAFRAVFARRRLDADLSTSESREYAWWRALVMEVIEETGRLADFGAGFDAYFADQFEVFARPEVWAFYDDVFPALDALRGADLRLAVVSNWDGRLHRLAAATALGGYMETIVTSAEAGMRKPDAAPFRLALERLGVSASEALFVGDSVAEDMEGARRAGIPAVLIDRGGTSGNREAVRRLTELPGLIPPGIRPGAWPR